MDRVDCCRRLGFAYGHYHCYYCYCCCYCCCCLFVELAGVQLTAEWTAMADSATSQWKRWTSLKESLHWQEQKKIVPLVKARISCTCRHFPGRCRRFSPSSITCLRWHCVQSWFHPKDAALYLESTETGLRISQTNKRVLHYIQQTEIELLMRVCNILQLWYLRNRWLDGHTSSIVGIFL